MAIRSKMRILLGVSGGIAAYKAVEVLRGLQREGAEVRVAMTAAALKFIQPLTFEALSGHRVYTELFPEAGDPEVIHVELGEWADLILIAPATANVIGKMANGLADDLLTCTVLSSGGARDGGAGNGNGNVPPPSDATQSPAARRYRILPDWSRGRSACIGPQRNGAACGPGANCRRSRRPGSDIRRSCGSKDRRYGRADGRRHRPGSLYHQSFHGKDGYAVARRARQRGADVVLVSGPGNLDPPAGVDLIR